jgi:DNA-directed RNA polymerase specialized sigma24 family protein
VTHNRVIRLIRERNAVKRGQGNRKVLSLDLPLRGHGEKPPELRDLISDDEVPTRPTTAQQEERRDLAIDVAEVIATLPKGLRKLAEQLQHYTVTELAELTGTRRTKFYESIGMLRRHFAAAGLDKYLPTHFGDSAQKE